MSTNNKTVKVEVLKSDDTKRVVYGIVLKPDVADAHGDIMTESEVMKSAHNYLMFHRNAGVEHSDMADALVVESFILPVNMELYGRVMNRGTWIVGMKVFDDTLWKKVQQGDFTAFSAGGYAKRVQE